MSTTLFSDRVNAVSSAITALTLDPAERLGIACALVEIFKFDLSNYLGAVEPPKNEEAGKAPAPEAANDTPNT